MIDILVNVDSSCDGDNVNVDDGDDDESIENRNRTKQKHEKNHQQVYIGVAWDRGWWPAAST